MPEQAGHMPGRDVAALAILIVATAFTFWLLMMCMHELGHVLAACATGGHVASMELSPLSLSRTDVSPNPRPLVVAWTGALFGALAPTLVAVVAGAARRRSVWLRAFAGFCLVANGLYLAAGMLAPVGDAEDLRRMGVPAAMLGGVGIVLAGAGGVLWHRLGSLWGARGVPPEKRRHRAAASIIGLGVVAGSMFAIDTLL